MTSFTEITICNSQTYAAIVDRVKKLSFLINSPCCQWIIDSYVSDFFTLNHWDKLPKCIQNYLDECDPNQLGWLLDKKDPFPNKHENVVPLYLLALQSSIKSLSFKRNAVDLSSQETLDDISRLLRCNVNNCSEEQDESVISSISKNPDFKNGQNMDMYHIFRRHVKPKKQHEIHNFGKTISLLASSVSANHVVDVGAGLGHLSRVLSFKHGLQVTTVEAADGHAPKAQQYDKDMKKEIHKVLFKKKSEPESESNKDSSENTAFNLDITLKDVFIYSEQSEYKTNENLNSQTQQKLATENIVTPQAEHDSIQQTSIQCAQDTSTQQTETHSSTKQHLLTQNDLKYPTSSPSISKQVSTSTHDQTATHKINQPNKNKSSLQSSDQETNGDENLPQHVVCLIEPDIATSQFLEILSNKTEDCSSPSACPPFVLTGLHACGDLTPTLLRVFSQCPRAVGLASVGCCYHKMTASSSSASISCDLSQALDNFPMSNLLRSSTDRSTTKYLSHEAREMACHAADAYKQRLESNSSHLKTHAFRASLQYLISQVSPQFQKGHVRIVSKKGSDDSFLHYLKASLGKVGIDFSKVPQDLLCTCEEMTNQWMRVVGFYTLRLSLAPAVETLVLLDRMLFLYEQGISSVMVPIFDSSMSPRNFALLAQKE